MIALYYHPGSANLVPHILLRELGVPFELRFVDRAVQFQKSEEYLKLNPNGRIPVLVDDDFVLFETVAICLYLVDKYPDAGFAPAFGSRERAEFYKWMIHLTNTPQAEFRAWFYPHEHVTDESCAQSVQDAAEQRLYKMFDVISEQLGEKTWLVADRFSAADILLFVLIRWGRTLPRPLRTIPNLNAFAERILSRAATRETFEAEGLQAPFF